MEGRMTEGKPLALILRFAVPMLMGNLLQQFTGLKIVFFKFVLKILCEDNIVVFYPESPGALRQI